MSKISIAGLDKAMVLAALYNASKPQGMGFLHYDPEPMTVEDARKLIERNHVRFDYLKGRVMKIDLSTDELDTWGYDRDNGQDAAQKALDAMKASGNVNDAAIVRTHNANMQVAALSTRALLDDETRIQRHGSATIMTMGLSDMAEHLEPKIDKVLGGKTE